MVRDGLLIFNSIHKVMSAEKLLKDAGLDVRVMPVPRSLSSDCGLAIAFRLMQRQAVEELLSAGDCPPHSLYRESGDEFEPLD